MSLIKKVFAPKAAILLGVAVLFAAAAFQSALAAGPVLKNINPQGTVTSSSVNITLDTSDLAKCRYSTGDTAYASMGNEMYTPDGLYHSGAIGTLSQGSYTYYVRCRDFEGNENSASAAVSFTVGDIGCIGANCPVVTPPPVSGGVPPALSNFSPTGTVASKYVTLSLSTDKAASCRYSWYNKEYDAMTLAFTSNNRLYHVASATLSNAGNYNYYVRCKDDSGNVNAPAGKISFYYYVYVAPKPPVTPVAPADTAPPSMSGLSPSGNVSAKEITLSLYTDETATCRYGKSDVDYELLPDNFGSAGTNHRAPIVLDSPGEHTYYVRCVDGAKNKNTVSGQIGFTYSLPEGPKISDLQPSGVIYQSTLALIATTDKAASCRFSENNLDYDRMGDFFDTSDGFLHQATIDLPDYGFYSYYVRCVDKEGISGDRSEMISFEYQNPNPEDESAPDEIAPIACEQIQIGARNGECDPTTDCVCDPDCPSSGENADPDCAGVAVPSGGGSGWVAPLFIGLILLIIIVIIIIIIIIIKRRGSEEDVELP